MAEFPLLRVALKDGRTVSIRHAIGSDVPRLQKFVEAYMLDGEGQTLEHDEFKVTMERQWQRLTDSLKNPKEILLLAEFDGNLVGKIDFQINKSKRSAHTGEFGMAVLEKWRNSGIGTALLQALLDWAQSNQFIEKINLHVLSSNNRAIALYRKFGFSEEGRQMREIKYADGSYLDNIAMARFV